MKNSKEPTRKKYSLVAPIVSAHLRFEHQSAKNKMTLCELQKRYPHIPQTTIYRHMKKTIEPDMPKDGRHNNKGRPKKLSSRDVRKLSSSVQSLREEVGDFYSTDVQRDANMQDDVSNRTVRRALHAEGYNYTQCRKKGQLVKPDLVKRLQWARRCQKLPSTTWTRDICFYLDGTGWVHKTNPSQNARTQRTRTWKKKNESLSLHCTSKGKKEGVGGKMARFMVAMAHGKGIIACHQYAGKLNGEDFAQMINDNFPEWFLKVATRRQPKIFLQDGDPTQNSAIARNAWQALGCERFAIPARSPDLNPIENIFHLIGNKLKADALQNNIAKESYSDFSRRVKQNALAFDKTVIDKAIESMPDRIAAVFRSKGARTKY